ncbi:hydroxymethylglutaryl-CoA reductase, degradative [Acinetobacter bouvetii DSM 14964 = CIP 107468]|uniref:3-hydroxy-3-methylglutaryl coenzyme A reductase n=1 Tax=Acinetobacter bouvetii DSM 14964 = CIP 107468 TaxID=1120925 RepID=N9DKZ8_9GAMM|nr:hydroxymethylglutaryl-CoA reductase, degradative [Acinetobacter bouvetii]ENV83359.1 hydroxymethylglutaryl-CoA reductase, degradative [Acinetobacter bouvetii DSM 14964 = CIP 107468]BCU65390.1 3-hydroxy-3-methylglutaryl coenzyme A reductase [Acinetobacter bouvetii]
MNSKLPDFRKLTVSERLKEVSKIAGLNAQQQQLLENDGALVCDLANGMIENVIGKFELPFGVAANFQINGKDHLIPMVVEEPSVVAAASYMAKIVRENGGFRTSSTEPLMRAQVQILGIESAEKAKEILLANKQEIIQLANSKDKFLISLGGGCKDIEVHLFESTKVGPMAVMHLIVNVCDAMGANTVNTMAETVTPLVEKLTGGQVRLRILSNLADLRLVRAELTVRPDQLKQESLSGEEVIERMLEAYEFAVIDPYRAATHNKGIMNGIDPVVVATGNDWRAIEAGAHVYAAKNGQYTSLTAWEKDAQGNLVGRIELPMAVGLVGGATKTHPLAQLSIQMLNIESASELGEVIAAVGLAQNMAAMRALATEGIQRGHMALHARNIAVVAGANLEEVDLIVAKMVAEHDVRNDRALELLAELRS